MDIELILLDDDYNRLKTVKNFTSLQWTERYYGVGDFDARFDVDAHIHTLLRAAYVYRKDTRRLGRVENRSADMTAKDAALRGRLIESALDDRVIQTSRDYNAAAEDVCREIVTEFCLTGDRTIPRLTLGEAVGLGEQIRIQRTGKTVLEVVTEILTEQEMSCRVDYDIASRTLAFRVFQGLDRTRGQTVNPWAVFSCARYNVITETYAYAYDAKNYAYVAGAGEGAERTVVTVDETDGGNRRELYVDARDLQPTETMTNDEYESALVNRGKDKLAEYNASETITFEADVNNAPFFALGDKCTYYQPDLDVLVEDRITEIYETYENDGLTVAITMGKEQLNASPADIKKIKMGGV